ncbi:MAG: pilin [bacterium]
MKKILLAICLSLLIGLPLSVQAVDGLGGAVGKLKVVTKGSGLETGELSTLEGSVGLIIKTALSVVGTIFLVLMVYAGILWMTAGGKEEKVETAGKIIKACIIGLFVVMSAYAVTYFITTSLGGTTGGSTGSGTTAISQEACQDLGGYCINSKSETEVVKGKNIKIDPSDPCDPDGVGDEDPFTGTSLGACSTSKTSLCCELKK